MERKQDRRIGWKAQGWFPGAALILAGLLSASLLVSCGKNAGGQGGAESSAAVQGGPEVQGGAGDAENAGQAENAGGTDSVPDAGSGGRAGSAGTGGTMQEAVPLDLSQVPAIQGGEDSFTIFLYMVGSDLETYGGTASADLREMREAALGDRVRILILAGGASSWAMPELSGGVKLLLLDKGGLHELADLGLANMAEEKTLETFLRWGAENCPAARRALLFWNHGGGTMMGFGHDEHFPHSLLSLADLSEAAGASGMHFSFVGFDACLMGTLETAKTFAPYADYLVASEETEPSSGWSYTGWLTMLGSDPDMDTRTLGHNILGEYIPEKRDSFDTYTLSLIDLSKIDALCSAVETFFANEEGLLKVDYKSLSRARNNTRAFGNGMFEQIDLVNFVQLNRTVSSQGNAVIDAAEKAVVESRSTINGANGIAVYFPYKNPDVYELVYETLRKVGFGDTYFNFFDSFMNTMIKGREASIDAGADTAEGQHGIVKYRDYEWYDPDWQAVPEGSVLDGKSMRLILDPEGFPSMSFNEEQRELMTGMTQRFLFFNQKTMTATGLGWYLWDAPKEEYYRCNPCAWPTINGHPVSYFELYNDPDYEYGIVPCIRNGKDFETILIGYSGDFLRDGGECELIGITSTAPEEINADIGVIRFETAKKGAMPLKEGDTFQFIRYDMSALDAELEEGEDGEKYRYFGEPVVYDGNWDIRLKDIFEASGFGPGEGRVMTQYLIYDIYQNAHKSEVLSWPRMKDGNWYYDY